MAFGKFSSTTGLTTWADGNVLTSSDFNVVSQVLPPIGAIIGWAKSLTGVPSLPTGWVECNGQTLSDADSPLNGRTIPNLNASGGGLKYMLKGSTTSGTLSDLDHAHNVLGGALSASTDPTTDLGPTYEVVWIMRVK